MRLHKPLLLSICLVLILSISLCGCAGSKEASSDGYRCEELYEKCLPHVVWLETSNGGGTGFFIEENVIITNNHVIDGAVWINATTSDGKTYPVTEIIGRSYSPDLAKLRIDGAGTPVTLNTHGLHEGEAIYSIGAPMGIFPTFSNGIIVHSFFVDQEVNFILGNMNVLSGNSGGPVFNRYGEVIGVVVGGMTDGNNSMDTIIHIDHLKDIDTSLGETLQSDLDYLKEMNRPDEEKYQLASLEDAQVGNLVKFGHYEQDCEVLNGAEDILWVVLERNGNELKLMSLYCLDTMPYNDRMVSVTWETSSIRAYLNNDFYNAAFTADEQSRMVQATVVNNDNPQYGTPGGEDTQDWVYLLSLEEVQQYWLLPAMETGAYSQLYAQATPYCMTRPIWLEIAGLNRCWWWLRSPGSTDGAAAEVGSGGYFSLGGCPVETPERAIRPVIHVIVP